MFDFCHLTFEERRKLKCIFICCDNPPFCALTSIWTTTFTAETAIPCSRRQLLSQWGIDKPMVFNHGDWRGLSIGWLPFLSFPPWKLLARCAERITWITLMLGKTGRTFLLSQQILAYLALNTYTVPKHHYLQDLLVIASTCDKNNPLVKTQYRSNKNCVQMMDSEACASVVPTM